MKEISQVIFDADMTLIDSFAGVYEIYCRVADHLEVERPETNKLISLWGFKIPDIVAEIFPDFNLEKVLEIVRKEARGTVHSLFPGVADSLTNLQNQGLKLGILSTSQKEVIIPHLEVGGIIHLFDRIVGGEDTVGRKPHPSVFDSFLVEREPEEMVYVGDDLRDYQAADAAGLWFLAVTTGFTEKEDFITEGLEFERILGSVAQVPQALILLM